MLGTALDLLGVDMEMHISLELLLTVLKQVCLVPRVFPS